jgi:hypothetical protein
LNDHAIKERALFIDKGTGHAVCALVNLKHSQWKCSFSHPLFFIRNGEFRKYTQHILILHLIQRMICVRILLRTEEFGFPSVSNLFVE